MKIDLSGVNPILNVFQEPVVLLQEGRVVFHNSAAAMLISELTEGAPCPQPLSFALPTQETDGIAVCIIAKKKYTVTTTAVSEYTMLVLRPIMESSEKMRQMASAFTEQIREQMTRLLAAAQQMESDLREKGEVIYDKWLAILNQSAYRMLRMLGAAELEQSLAGGDLYHPGTLDLAGLCHELEWEVAPLVKQMGITFHYESQDMSLLTTGDAVLLRRMLLGLISNAIKVIGQGGTMGLRLTRRNGRVMLTIWDDGPGMDERSLGALFQEEQDGSIPRPGEGLRLGLYNARNIATMHGGVLVVESKKGQGARFTVSLPIKQPEGLPLRTPKSVFDDHGGFSPLLVELSDALPWQVFLPEELE